MLIALIRKEIKENIVSRKGLLIFFVVSLLFSALAFSFVSVKELSLLAQVEVNMTFLKMMLGVSILVSSVLGASLISGEKERGTLESLLLTPLTKIQITIAKLMVILAFWLVLTLISLPYLFALSSGTTLFPTIVMYLYVIGTPLVLSFGGLSLIFSSWVSSTKNALLFSIILFFISALPMFLSTTMKKSGFAYYINQLSPASSSILALKDILVNKLSFSVVLQDIIPVLVFLILIAAGLYVAGKKVNLSGDE
jgi:ABC-2 type transport system permease protein